MKISLDTNRPIQVPGRGGEGMAGRARSRAAARRHTSTSCTPCQRPIADIAYQNKAVIYDILFKASAETMITIAADPKHLGARIGITSVLHTWGSAMTHHPHVHMIVPGGGLSQDGRALDRLSTGLLLARPCAVTAVPTPSLGDVDRGSRGRPTPVLRRARSAR